MTLPGEWRLCWSAVSPLVYLLVAGPTRPVPLGTVIVVLRLKNPVGTGLVKVTYIQHTTIQCMGGRGGVEDLDPAVSQDIVDAVSSGLRVLLDASLTLKSRGSGGVSSIGTRHNSSNRRGGGAAAHDPLLPHAYLKGCVCVCLGAWGYRGMYAIIAISRLCQEESHPSSCPRIRIPPPWGQNNGRCWVSGSGAVVLLSSQCLQCYHRWAKVFSCQGSSPTF